MITKSNPTKPHDIPIVHNLYELYKHLHVQLVKFPKHQRYTLGATAQNQTLEILRLTIRTANSSDGKLKKTYLQQASSELDLLRLLIRMGKDCQCLSNKHYLELEAQLITIGKMLGGWLRSVS